MFRETQLSAQKSVKVLCVYRDSREEALGEYYMRKYAKSSGGEQ